MIHSAYLGTSSLQRCTLTPQALNSRKVLQFPFCTVLFQDFEKWLGRSSLPASSKPVLPASRDSRLESCDCPVDTWIPMRCGEATSRRQQDVWLSSHFPQPPIEFRLLPRQDCAEIVWQFSTIRDAPCLRFGMILRHESWTCFRVPALATSSIRRLVDAVTCLLN